MVPLPLFYLMDFDVIFNGHANYEDLSPATNFN